MDELHQLAAVSYVSLKPVRAGLVGHAADCAWSNLRTHLAGEDDGLVTVRPLVALHSLRCERAVPASCCENICRWQIVRRCRFRCRRVTVPMTDLLILRSDFRLNF